LVFCKADNVSTADDASDYDWAVFAIKSWLKKIQKYVIISDIDLMNRRAKLNFEAATLSSKALSKVVQQLFS